MELSGREILIDTYNLRLREGSGIKTYGLSLIQALRHAGAGVSLLTDRPMRRSRYRALDEVNFFDQANAPRPPASRWRQALRMVSHAARPLTPYSIRPARVISPQEIVPGRVARYCNLAELYDTANRTYQRLGRLTRLRIPDPPAIWHATTPLPIRIRRARMVTTIHDLIPLRLPYTTLDDKRFFYRLVRDALRDSALVLTVSECSKRDILAFYDVPEEKIAVTYQSLPQQPPSIDRTQAKMVLKRYRLTSGQYILFVGNIEPKKNLAVLIQAASMLEQEIPLVVVGRKAWLWEEQLAAAERYFGKKTGRLRLLGYVPNPILSILYGNALCLAFPSLYEGFGLPALEAMRHGCPVICSNAASLPEVCGEAALYMDPNDPDALRAHVEKLLEDITLRSRLAAAGHDRVKEFSPARHATRLAEAYRRVPA